MIFKLCIEIVIDHDKSLVFKSSYASCEVLYIRSFTALQVFFTKVEKITIRWIALSGPRTDRLPLDPVTLHVLIVSNKSLYI